MDGTKRKILIIDDEKKFCEMVKKNLEATGNFEVQYQVQGKEGLATALSFRPDLAIIDIMFPDIEGYEVAAQIKKHERFKKLPVIFLSAIVKKGQKEIYGGLVDGVPFIAKPLLSKPVNTKDLIQCIETNLQPPAKAA